MSLSESDKKNVLDLIEKLKLEQGGKEKKGKSFRIIKRENPYEG
ncbi:hypothetical protein MATR_33020 [Marivirga tractuosa]|uniref:Uncharacterized protein n=1 Tax=Marivirga tractuosa (strain ATCC 23168 / DSM 4126 / NBRC 15989 / NCIMB 1408 / VKM B-1430 / H-43) TaxID=643867 RepID=E4TSD4_MARTH|nr:hypothetical protein [Marivirga tractuosa]ADR22851.1 hypothetical protein Ftrac_2874 [Marivirga tractuosa DSM 4126]BDD16477.1 hypothetical protein MATR_33020 [Marivirga tractuosa]